MTLNPPEIEALCDAIAEEGPPGAVAAVRWMRLEVPKNSGVVHATLDCEVIARHEHISRCV